MDTKTTGGIEDTGEIPEIEDTDEIPETVLRRELERLFGPLDNEIWSWVKDRGSLRQVIEAEVPFESLVRELAQLQRIAGTPQQRRAAPHMLVADDAGTADNSAREVALSRIVATVMTSDAAVVAFREDPAHQLENRLLDWEAVQAWILSWETQGVPPTRYIDHVPIPPSVEPTLRRALIHTAQMPEVAQSALSDKPPPVQLSVPVAEVNERARFSLLRYGIPDDPEEFVVPVREGTPLDRLQQLSADLAARTTWSEAQAALFVLTGLTPMITTMQSEVQQNLELPGMSRIVLTVDPSLSPREVTDRFRAARKTFYQHRHRELSDKHVQLALFAALDAPEDTVAARMATWNNRFPDWAYKQESNFSRDSLQAQRRLIGSPVNRRRGRTVSKKGEGL